MRKQKWMIEPGPQCPLSKLEHLLCRGTGSNISSGLCNKFSASEVSLSVDL